MPTYEYACKSCGQHVEVVQSFSDDPLTICAVCGGRLRKVFGTIGISFKGSGFYRNDSRSSASGSKAAASSEKSGSSSSSEKSGSSSEKSGSSSTMSGSGSGKRDSSSGSAAAAAS